MLFPVLNSALCYKDVWKVEAQLHAFLSKLETSIFGDGPESIDPETSLK
jgi:hypothetical protein